MKSVFGWITGKPPRPGPGQDAADAWATLRGAPPRLPPPPDPPPDPPGAAAPPEGPPAPEPPEPLAAEPPPDEPPPPVADPPRRRLAPLAAIGRLRRFIDSAPPYAGPDRIGSFVEITDLGALGTLAAPHRLRLHPPMRSARPAPLFNAAALPRHIRDLHDAHPEAPAVEVLALPGHELGGAGLLQREGRVFFDANVMPGYIGQHLTPDRLTLPEIWRGGLLRPDTEVIETDTPVALAFHPNLVYGHFLLEMLPRLHALATLRAYGRAFPIAVPTDWPAWAREFVALYYDPSEIIWYDKDRQRLRAPCFVLPTMMHRHYDFHPAMTLIADTAIARAGAIAPAAPATEGATPTRLYLSRGEMAGGPHGLVNEPEVEETLVQLGFTVLRPAELPVARQLALYDGASLIVSAYGWSSLNSLFAPRGAGVFCVNWRDEAQSRVCALRGQPVAYFAPDEGFGDPADDAPVTANSRDLARQLAAFERTLAEPPPPPHLGM
jgi:hypothetical protein